MSTRRALHFVFKVADRSSTINFYRNILGMKVLRHEEFEKGCEAACNGPYDGKWSKTMIGYGSEDDHFVIELTYNYGIKSYARGNEFINIALRSQNVRTNADTHGYPTSQGENGALLIADPDGYTFSVSEESARGDPVESVSLSSSDLQKSVEFWRGVLGMELYHQEDNMARLGFAPTQCSLVLKQIDGVIDRGEAYGRIAFSCPDEEVKAMEKVVSENKHTILTPYISLDTPGKATVQVVIVADPDGHEICFVGDVGFRDLSTFDPEGDKLLNDAMASDKSVEWFAKKKERERLRAENANK